MNKFTKIFTVLFAVSLLFSCNNSFNNDIQNEEAQIVLNICNGTGRTAFANIPTEDFTDIVLQYKKTGAADYEVLASYENVADISVADVVYLTPDKYDFMVTANASGFIYKGVSLEVQLVRGPNTVDVTLVLDSMVTPSGNGSFSISFTVPDKEISICNYAEFTLSKNDAVISEYENIECPVYTEQNSENRYVSTFLASGGPLASGMYDIVINVYTDSYKTLELASFEESIQIVDGIPTEKSYSTEQLNYNIWYLESDIVGTNSDAFYIKTGNKIYFCGEGVIEFSEEQLSEAEEYNRGVRDSFVYGAEIFEAYIGAGITEIGEGFFASAENLKKLYGAENVTKINDVVFADLFRLEEIPSFENVTYIGDEAFSECQSLTQLPEFPKLEYLGELAFYACMGLEEINGFNAVTAIKEYTFTGCENLTKITGFNAVTEVEDGAFEDCYELNEITGFNAVTELPVNAINFKQLKHINGFNSVTAIPEDSFSIPTVLSGFPYYNSNEILETVEGFNSVVTIGDNSFYKCYNLTKVSGFEKAETIGVRAFYYCTSLSEIPLFESVTSIGESAFEFCEALTSIGKRNPDGEDEEAFPSLTDGNNIGANAFNYCKNLHEIIGFNKLESLYKRYYSAGGSQYLGKIFYLYKISYIKGFNSVTYIEEGIFEDLREPENITLEGFNSIETLYNDYSSSKPVLDFTKVHHIIGFNKVEYPQFLRNIWNETPENIETIEGFAGATTIVGSFKDFKNLKSITGLNNIPRVEVNAFNGCESLEEITILSSEITFDNNTNIFEGCTSLKKITFAATKENVKIKDTEITGIESLLPEGVNVEINYAP